MTTDPLAYGRAKSIFLAVCDLAAGEQEATLDRLCADDPALRGMVDEMLVVDAADSDWMELSTRGDGTTEGERATAGFDLPGQIAGFTVETLLGEGATGWVVRASQHRPRRTVALKVLRSGFVSKRLLRRFEYEAELLAGLEHPNVARVYEVGEDARVGPYIAMEYVAGEPLTEFARGRLRSDRERVELFRDVCHGVEHAHQKGILHRDLKPANIIVNEEGSPKVLDFGLGRRVNGPDETRTELTQHGEILGTLAYMSPEQTEGRPEAIDTRADVYSLGVILYVLLADAMPYDIKGHTPWEALRVIREASPVPFRSVGREVDSDLETIVRKCLEKAPERRYESVSALAADVGRFLRHEPISARPPSALYQLRKLATRHRLGFAAAIVVMLVTIVGFIVASVLYAQAETARREEARQKGLAIAARNAAREQERKTDLARKVAVQRFAEAEGEAAVARAVSAFITDFLAQADPYNVDDARSITVEQAARAAARQVVGGLETRPEVEAGIRYALARTFLGQGDLANADVQFQECLALREKVNGPDHHRTAEVLIGAGSVARHQGKVEVAFAAYERALGILEAVSDPPDELVQLHMSLLVEMSAADLQSAELRRGERRVKDALRLASRVGQGTLTLAAWRNLALIHSKQGRFEEALGAIEKAEAVLDASGRSESVMFITVAQTKAYLQRSLTHFDDAAASLRRALAVGRKVLSERSALLGNLLVSLGVLERELGQLDDADARYRAGEEVLRRAYPNGNSALAVLANNRGRLAEERGDVTMAEKCYRRSLALHARHGTSDWVQVSSVRYNLANLLTQQKEFEEAETLFKSVLEERIRECGPRHPLVAHALFGRSVLERARGRLNRARKGMRRVVSLRREEPNPESNDNLAAALIELGGILIDAGEPAEALPHLEEAMAISRRRNQPQREPLMTLGRARLATGDDKGAESAFLAFHRRCAPARAADVARQIAALYEQAGHRDRAAAWRQRE